MDHEDDVASRPIWRYQKVLHSPSRFLESGEELNIVDSQEGLDLSSLHSQPDIMQNYSETNAELGDPGGDTVLAAAVDSAEPVMETDVVFVPLS